MKGHIPQETIEEIKSRTNIADIVSDYVSLRKTGRNLVGLCPFHKEKTPSFTVNEDKQIFYCFGCGEGGNVISFFMKVNNMTFPEAVRGLAAKAGVVLPKREKAAENAREDNEREVLNRINRAAADFYAKNLFSSTATVAQKYLLGRQMTEAAVRTFRLGFASDGWQNLKKHMDRLRIPEAFVEKAGLVIRSEKGRYYDRFRGRVIFPIESLNGTVVAFGGRELGEGEPKYLNSPESPVYVKGEHLYGLSQTKQHIRQSDYAIVVEGYFDLLALWLSGITNVIATLGTALTKRQIELIRRFTRNVVLLFDSDDGGRHAVERGIRLFLEEGMRARVAVMPEGFDPADYVREFGRDAMNELLRRSVSMADYYIEKILQKGTSIEETWAYVRGSIPLISGISDPIQRDLFIKRVAARCGIDETILAGEVRKAIKTPSGPATPARNRPEPVVDIAELTLLIIIGESSERMIRFIDDGIIDFFSGEQLRELAEGMIERHNRGQSPDFTGLVSALDDGTLKDKLMKAIVERPPLEEPLVEREFEDSIEKIRSRWFKNRRLMIQRELVKAGDNADVELKEKLLREKDQLLKEAKRPHIK